jgi:glycosyltransferase involved in cell wall biosynthesis
MVSPHSTGIQKVVRSIVRESKSVGLSMGMQCIPVSFELGDLIRISPVYGPRLRQIELKQGESGQLLRLAPGQLFRLASGQLLRLAQKVDSVLSKCLPISKLYQKFRRMLAPIIRNLYRMTQHRTDSEWEELIKAHVLGEEGNDLGSPPILLLLDSTWDEGIWDVVDKFRASGGHVCVVLYDLIPFLYPETVEESTRKAHTTWWKEVPLHVDSVMCISQSVREDFLVWQQKEKFSSPIPADKVKFFYLGAECNQVDTVIKVSSLDIPIFLVVGSLEPRKNHSLILDAFELLWEQGCDVNLTVVGAHGWKSKDVIDRIKNHPELGQKLIFINDATDRDLVLLYERSTALIIASLAEGFGLPIVEAFKYGTKVICSDIPVFREVAGDHAEYFEPTNAGALANKVSESVSSLRSGLYQKKGVTKEWISWKESTEQLFTRMLAITTNSEASPDLTDDNDLS